VLAILLDKGKNAGCDNAMGLAEVVVDLCELSVVALTPAEVFWSNLEG
jgi:hypothetical protein